MRTVIESIKQIGGIGRRWFRDMRLRIQQQQPEKLLRDAGDSLGVFIWI
jgi:hypothetical protein